VQQAQHRIAILDGLSNQWASKPQIAAMARGMRARIVQRGIERAEGFSKPSGLEGQMLAAWRDRPAGFLGQVATDVPEFFQIMTRGALGDLGLEGV
jgi:hypothetical protein